jgi:hypothetical protein
MTIKFQDGRHIWNSSECYKIDNYHPLLMKIGTQTQKNMLSSKFIIPEVLAKFQDGRRRPFRNWRACNKLGICHPILMQIGTQTKKNMLSSKFIIPEV